MSFIAQENDDMQDYYLFAKINNSKNVLQLLKAVSFKEHAIVFASSKGFKVTVEDSKSVQANAFIQADMFQEYYLKEDMVTFKISLNTLVECLSIFSSSGISGVTPALKMCYAGYGCPLTLLLEEAGAITDCSIKTLDPEDTLDFKFTNADVLNKIIMESDCLKEIFSGFDMSSDVIEIIMSPNAPHFRISTFGNYGVNHVDIPRDSEVIESFSCTQTTKHRYKLLLMKPSIKPLAASQKISIRVDDRGFLCMQFMIKTEDNHVCFIELYCAPEENVDED